MLNHELQSPPRKERRRIGRGGKRGTTSGRGTKGQGAHNKHKPDLFEGGRSSLLKRLKKVRGFKAVTPKRVTLALTQLERAFQNGDTVDRGALLAKGLLSARAQKSGAKVVDTGILTKALTLGDGVVASATAQKYFSGDSAHKGKHKNKS